MLRLNSQSEVMFELHACVTVFNCSYYSFIDVTSPGSCPQQRKLTILADYNFCMTTKIDDSFQFIDCEGVNGRQLAKDIHVGIVPIHHDLVCIALGNSAKIDQYTNVVSTVTAVINALVERFGCP